jgi:hypothetical protein
MSLSTNFTSKREINSSIQFHRLIGLYALIGVVTSNRSREVCGTIYTCCVYHYSPQKTNLLMPFVSEPDGRGLLHMHYFSGIAHRNPPQAPQAQVKPL